MMLPDLCVSNGIRSSGVDLGFTRARTSVLRVRLERLALYRHPPTAVVCYSLRERPFQTRHPPTGTLPPVTRSRVLGLVRGVLPSPPRLIEIWSQRFQHYLRQLSIRHC